MRNPASLPTRFPARPGISHHPPPQQPAPPQRPPHYKDEITRVFYENSNAKRIYTDTLMRDTISKEYPNLNLVTIPMAQPGGSVDFIAYAAIGFASATPTDESALSPLKHIQRIPAARRGEKDQVGEAVTFGKYTYKWKNHEFIMYFVDIRDGTSWTSQEFTHYLVGVEQEVADELLLEASSYFHELHDEIWVFDFGYWSKSRELYESMDKASWDDVILEKEMKQSIQNDISRFFKSQDKYDELKVPWKRGLIFYGPPGNGKTISIKAIMHDLYQLKEPIPTLYVRSFVNIFGPEAAISEVFAFARKQAPCLLIFEDLDSFVTDEVKSYFFNEIDGIAQSLGVLMVGSTNHLDRLDPGIRDRPSRFDRKFNFPLPSYDQRVQYCEYWKEKLKGSNQIEFPHALSREVARITEKFSYAYMQEAFVASLLAIAARDEDTVVAQKSDKDELKDNILWQEMKRQVNILRGEL